MSMRPFSRQVLVAGLIASMCLSGCTRTVTHSMARYEPGGEALPTTQPVRTAAVWKVKVRQRGEKDYHGIDGTERWLQKGDVVGFRSGEDGVVYAVVNREEIPLQLTSDHRRVVWHSKKKETTGFGEAMSGALSVTGMVAAGVGLTALLLYGVTHPTDEDCNTSSY